MDWTKISAGLAAEFPREAIHWRAQTLTRNGDKALALAYLDARDVMERLDAVVGPENWQDSYVETAKGRLICTLSIRCGGEWIAKADGAGETDVEGEKGAISAALKRAAVKWGIGRYLYDMPDVWAPCKTYTPNGGKPKWDSWIGSPWDHVRGRPKPSDRNADITDPAPTPLQPDRETECRTLIDGAASLPGLQVAWKQVLAKYTKADPPPEWLIRAKDERKAALSKADPQAPADPTEPPF